MQVPPIFWSIGSKTRSFAFAKSSFSRFPAMMMPLRHDEQAILQDES